MTTLTKPLTPNWRDWPQADRLAMLSRLKALRAAATPEQPTVLWSPEFRTQQMAVESPADVLGFGGSAGGGKTDCLLGLAVTRHRRSIIFRREAKQGRSMVDRSREILSAHARFNAVDGVWRGIPGGRQLEFAGVKDPGDVFNWRGQPHDLIGIDESDSFLESQVRFLFGWLRTTVPGQRCRAVLTFNPPATAEGRWLIRYFAPWLDKQHPRPAVPGELRWFATTRGGREVECGGPESFECRGEVVRPQSRTFIPSRVTDNPYLMATDYVTQLQSLPEPLRSQLLYGDMEAGTQDDAMQVVPTEWVLAAQARWRPEGLGVHVPLSSLGVDVARGGPDQTTLAPRYRNWFAELICHPGTTTPDGDAVAYLVEQAVGGVRPEDRSAPINVDAIGVGAAVVDACRRLRMNVVPVVSSESCLLPDRAGVLEFANLRAWAWWSLRDALDPAHGDDLALPPDRELLADLTAPRWKPRAGGIIIEDKDEVRKRIGRSPDRGDAVVLAHLQLFGGAGAAPAFRGGRGR